jgi:hypothetical protein
MLLARKMESLTNFSSQVWNLFWMEKTQRKQTETSDFKVKKEIFYIDADLVSMLSFLSKNQKSSKMWLSWNITIQKLEHQEISHQRMISQKQMRSSASFYNFYAKIAVFKTPMTLSEWFSCKIKMMDSSKVSIQ